jgi:hypothetical protein
MLWASDHERGARQSSGEITKYKPPATQAPFAEDGTGVMVNGFFPAKIMWNFLPG